MAVDPALQDIIDRPDDTDPDKPAEPAKDAPKVEPGSDSWLDTLEPDVAKEIRKLRGESGGYRQKLRQFEELFDGYDADDAQFLKDLVRDIKSSPGTAAQRAQQLVNALAGAVEPETPVSDDDKPVTAAEARKMAEKMLADYEAKQTNQKEVDAYVQAAVRLGYEEQSRPMRNLLMAATEVDQNLSPSEAIAAAHKILQDERQAIIDEAFNKKQTDAERSPRLVTRSGSAPGGDKGIKSIKEGSAALKEALAAGDIR